MKRDKRGFTLGELLIVVAIIGVLVAISIPVFKGKLDKAKETTCLANRRSLYSEVANGYLGGDYSSLSGAFNELYTKGGSKNVNEYVCPAGGTFTWQDNGDGTGKIICSYHDKGQSGGGGGSGGSSGDTVPGTDIPVSSSYWPKQSEYENSYDTKTVSAGGIFKYTDGSYYVVNTSVALTKGQAASGPGGTVYGWYATQKITGRVVTFNSNEQKSDLARGDVCKEKGKYYVYIDGGSWAYSPSVNPNQWYALP